MIYSILGAIVVILIVALAVYFHVRSEDDESTAAPRSTKTVNKPAPPVPAPVTQAETSQAVETEPEVTVRQLDKRGVDYPEESSPLRWQWQRFPGSVEIDSTPQGAQIQLDGRGRS